MIVILALFPIFFWLWLWGTITIRPQSDFFGHNHFTIISRAELLSCWNTNCRTSAQGWDKSQIHTKSKSSEYPIQNHAKQRLKQVKLQFKKCPGKMITIRLWPHNQSFHNHNQQSDCKKWLLIVIVGNDCDCDCGHSARKKKTQSWLQKRNHDCDWL